MPTFIEGLGQSAASSAASGILGMGMGLLLQGHNDRRQLRQQEKLMNLEMGGQRSMIDYNMAKQYEMWEKTNYKAQMEQLAKAGLNPGLIYGMGGGGGATTGSSQGHVTGGQAPQGGGESLGMAMQMMNMQLMKAQADKLKADTELTIASIPKTGAERDKIVEEIKAIKQGVLNAQVQNSILKWEDNLKRIDSNIAEQTQGDRMGQIVSLAEHASSAAEMIERDNQIAEATKLDKINQIKALSIGAVLQNDKIANEIVQKWTELSLREGELNVKAFEAQLKAEYPSLFNVVGGALNGVIRILSGNKNFESSNNPKSGGK